MKTSDNPLVRWRPGGLLPADRVQDAALVFAAAVLCFFACLAVIAALGADRAARGWTGELTGSATVLVRPSPGETADAAAARAAETLAGVKGVSEAVAVERAKAEELVRPWLGEGADLSDLPMPRLVTVELDRNAPATLQSLSRALVGARVDAVVDDHGRWIEDIVRAAALARTAAIAAALLVALAAAAVITFATRAGFSARSEVVETLHLTGAEDRFIAGLFQWRFALLGAAAGALGATGAALVAAVFRLAGGGGAAPVLPVAWSDLAVVLLCPPAAAIVAALAARLTALSRLKEMR